MHNMRTKAVIVLIISMAATAASMAVPPDPNNPTGANGLILVDKVGRYIRFFDPATLKELSSFQAGTAPHDVAISPDHRTAYIPIYGDGIYGRNPNPGHEVAIVDLASQHPAAPVARHRCIPRDSGTGHVLRVRVAVPASDGSSPDPSDHLSVTKLGRSTSS